MTAPEIVRIENLSKRFVLHKDKSVKERLLYLGRSRDRKEDFWALRDIDLAISAGTTVGLVGHNGSGKSTLLKMIGGIIEPTSGTVLRRGRLAALLELGAGFHPDLTGRENVFLNASILGLSRKETARSFDAIVDFAGIADFIDTQVKFYSSGMYVRLAFAVAVHVDPDLLLVDEVLAVGDEPFQRKCLDKIAEFQAEGRTIILVSHSSEQVGSLCDRVVVLEHGRMIFDGDPPGGLRELRESFAREREMRAEILGSPVKVSTVAVEAERGAQGIRAGSDLVFRIAFTVEGSVEPWMITLAVETPTGSLAYRMSTADLDVELPTRPGSYSIDITWRHVNLGGGQYSVNLAVATAVGHTLQSIHPATTFSVEENGVGRGIVRFDTSAVVSPGGSTPTP